MSRKPISQDRQTKVLLQSRRRCCICFGLNRDVSICQGQIAHLDRSSSNDAEDNLAFLCFNHHDQYDSSTRQSKNFMQSEVKHFRTELHVAMKMALGAPVQFGEAIGFVDFIPGHYIRVGEHESAELKIQRLSDGRYYVTGTALWGSNREYGPNIGELHFLGDLHGDSVEYRQTCVGEKKEYRFSISFCKDRLTVKEENWTGMFGLNVYFSGQYDKAT